MLFKRTVRDDKRRETNRRGHHVLPAFASRINRLTLLVPPW